MAEFEAERITTTAAMDATGGWMISRVVNDCVLNITKQMTKRKIEPDWATLEIACSPEMIGATSGPPQAIRIHVGLDAKP